MWTKDLLHRFVDAASTYDNQDQNKSENNVCEMADVNEPSSASGSSSTSSGQTLASYVREQAFTIPPRNEERIVTPVLIRYRYQWRADDTSDPVPIYATLMYVGADKQTPVVIHYHPELPSWFNNVAFRSLSVSALHISRTSQNGWNCWHVHTGDERWVPLSAVRTRGFVNRLECPIVNPPAVGNNTFYRNANGRDKRLVVAAATKGLKTSTPKTSKAKLKKHPVNLMTDSPPPQPPKPGLAGICVPRHCPMSPFLLPPPVSPQESPLFLSPPPPPPPQTPPPQAQQQEDEPQPMVSCWPIHAALALFLVTKWKVANVSQIRLDNGASVSGGDVLTRLAAALSTPGCVVRLETNRRDECLFVEPNEFSELPTEVQVVRTIDYFENDTFRLVCGTKFSVEDILERVAERLHTHPFVIGKRLDAVVKKVNAI